MPGYIPLYIYQIILRPIRRARIGVLLIEKSVRSTKLRWIERSCTGRDAFGNASIFHGEIKRRLWRAVSAGAQRRRRAHMDERLMRNGAHVVHDTSIVAPVRYY